MAKSHAITIKAARAAAAALAAIMLLSGLPLPFLGVGISNGEEAGGGMKAGEEAGPFVDAPHLSAGSVTMQGVEASPFMAGSEEGGGGNGGVNIVPKFWVEPDHPYTPPPVTEAAGRDGGRGVNGYAVLMGINAYPSSPLQGCISDITAVRDKLVNSYGWSSANIHFLTDAAVTPARITQEIQWLASTADSGSQTVFSFSGHGSPHTIYAYPMDGVSDTTLATEFKKLRSQENVCILDSCFSGANTAVNITAPPFISLMACAADETAADGNTFTKAWVEGLGTTQYGEVEDAFPYAYNKVQGQPYPQHPVMWDNIAGKMMLGRRPPVINGTIPDLSAPEDTPVSITLTANESDPVDGHGQLNWSVAWWNASHISNITGQRSANDTLTFFPVKNWNGKTAVELTLTNSAGRTASQNISITWTPVNDLPSVTGFDKLWPTVERMKGIKSIVYGHDVDDSESTLGIEVQYRPSGGDWTSAKGNISYMTNHWELMLVPGASCPLGQADIRARLKDAEGWSDWTAASGFILITNSPPAVSSLATSAAQVRRAQGIILTVRGADAENPRENLSCEVEVKPANETAWIRLSSVGLAGDRWNVSFKPQPRAILGMYDARARLRDADSANGDWRYCYSAFTVQNALPVASSLELSAQAQERGSPVTVVVRGSDVEDPLRSLVCDVHYKGPTGGWARLENVSVRDDHWEARFLPLSYFKEGRYSFRAIIKDSAGELSDWVYQNDSLEVTNSLPGVSAVNFSKSSVLRGLNVTLTIQGRDYEDPRPNLTCAVEYSTGGELWSAACIKELRYDDRSSGWVCVFDAVSGIDAGAYQIRARLQDRDRDWGEWFSPAQFLQVQNNGPVARIAPHSLVVNELSAVAFDGSPSTDAEGPLGLCWDFGDGARAEGETVTHVFTEGGNKDVVLTVTDADGATAKASVRLRVNLLPQARAGFSQMPGENEFRVRLDATGSTDAEGAVVACAWDFDNSVDSDLDGRSDNDVDSTSAYPTFDYKKEGVRTAKLTVTDADNGSASVLLVVKVKKNETGNGLMEYLPLIVVAAMAVAVVAAAFGVLGKKGPG
jgi:hypothetical protein